MTTPILASISPDAGITALHLIGMKAQKLWSGGDIQDGRDEPAATRFALKLDADMCEVYRDVDLEVFRLKFTSRVSIVHNDKAHGTQYALTDKQRRELKQKLCCAAMDLHTEQMNNRLENPVYLLDHLRQQDSAEEIIKDLQILLRLSANRRQKSMAPSQSHWGIHNFIDTFVNENTIGDVVLGLVSHLMVDWAEQGLLHTLKIMSIASQQHIEVPCNTGPMHVSSSEAFAVVVLEFELCLQLDG